MSSTIIPLHTGIVFSLRNPKDPAKARELNDWVVKVHYREVLEPGILVGAMRLENPEATGDAKSPRFLTMYKTNRSDPAAAWTEHTSHNARLRDQGLITQVSPQLSSVMLGVFKRIRGPQTINEGTETRGILAVLFDCRTGGWEEWCDEVHVPEVLAAGPYHTATRYENTGLHPNQPLYLTIYETDWDDPVGALQLVRSSLKQHGDRRTVGEAEIQVKLCSPFKLTHSQTKASS